MRPTTIVLVVSSILYWLPAQAIADESFHIYAPSRSTQELLVFAATEKDGHLKLESKPGVKLGFPGATITAHEKLPLLYVAPLRDSNNHNTSGAVIRLLDKQERIEQSPIQLHHGYAYLSVDRTNRFLLGVHYFSGYVDVYSLDKDGKPGKRVTALDEGRLNAHCVLTSPDNRFIYIPYVKDTNALFQYSFNDSNGSVKALKPKNAKPPKGTGPRHMAYHPKLPIVYFSNEQNLGVSVYDQRKSGQLKIKQVCNLISDNESKDGVSSSDIAITSDGAFLFAGIRGHQRDFDWISRYRIKSSGEVELLGKTPADKIPWGLTLSPSGRYLIVSAFQGETITAYKIGKDGSLTKSATIKCPKQISDIVTR